MHSVHNDVLATTLQVEGRLGSGLVGLVSDETRLAVVRVAVEVRQRWRCRRAGPAGGRWVGDGSGIDREGGLPAT